ncbi:MAG: hypothetical protein DLM70_19190 [Chloroflexi bacterium]|nr:MAG: hypothetical protein DLM70_19190 [Chloroflexota bacterium]
MSTLSQPVLWISTSVAAVLLLLSATLVSWLLRVPWIVVTSARDVRRLPLRGLPFGLQEAVERTGARRVRCWIADVPLAFCSGSVQPEIFVTDSLVTHLRACELDSVLVHEMHHSRRRAIPRERIDEPGCGQRGNPGA